MQVTLGRRTDPITHKSSDVIEIRTDEEYSNLVDDLTPEEAIQFAEEILEAVLELIRKLK